MPESQAVASALLQWGVAARTLHGETESGDLHLVQAIEPGTLVGVVDGLGHGAEAASVARAAVAALEAHAREPVRRLLERCHQALVGTRGAVMSLAVFNRLESSMSWLGVGNVAGVLIRADPGARPARMNLISRGGIVGSKLPPLDAQTILVARGDTLIFATDGITGSLTDALPPDASPQQLADLILARGGRLSDDALVLVARYTGRAGR